jgi:F-box and WD-40 domain protein CDC4
LEEYQAVHRLAAHDNSVTSLQFDDSRIVSGGSDGRVKIWNLQTGTLIRELSQPAEAVWRVAFEEERSVVLASRQGRTVMEVWDFSPPDEDEPLSAPLSRDTSAQKGEEKSIEDCPMQDAPIKLEQEAECEYNIDMEDAKDES